MPRTAADYEKQAAECRQMAREATNAKARDTLHDMARTWETLARQARRLEDYQRKEKERG
jgi:hypothetical protein